MMQKSAQYLSEKFGVNHLLPTFSSSDDHPVKKEHQKLNKPTVVKAQVHHNHPVAVTDVNGNNQASFMKLKLFSIITYDKFYDFRTTLTRF